jgi:hypothetical protein
MNFGQKGDNSKRKINGIWGQFCYIEAEIVLTKEQPHKIMRWQNRSEKKISVILIALPKECYVKPHLVSKCCGTQFEEHCNKTLSLISEYNAKTVYLLL